MTTSYMKKPGGRRWWAGRSLFGFVLAALVPVAIASWTGSALAAIDFETLPNGSPTIDGQLITTEYQSAFGVSFEILNGGGLAPRIAKVGSPRTAFEGADSTTSPGCGVAVQTRDDMPATGAQVGCSFLTDDGIIDQNSFTLRVRYTFPVNAAHGTLLDVDGVEAWTVTARASDESVVLQVQVLPPGPDGAASTWAFPQGPNFFSIIDLEQTGSTDGVGLAFDNFSPDDVTGVPEPGRSGGIVLADSPRPNPFHDRTRCRIVTQSQLDPEVVVYDIEGRSVATLLGQPRGAGEYDLEWNGRDASGYALAEGIYFIRMRADDLSATTKVMIVR
jgi:flagellar hook capping protein FlgD